MENCLVTKLKAVVNNPNLPFFEEMQQFTLDVITASGNDSMTNVQKGALNHFFYRIGAINNSSIYTKINKMFLPCICNANISKALYDYKRGVNIPADTVASYYGNGITKITSAANDYTTARLGLRNSYAFDNSDFSCAVGIYEPESGELPHARIFTKFNYETDSAENNVQIKGRFIGCLYGNKQFAYNAGISSTFFDSLVLNSANSNFKASFCRGSQVTTVDGDDGTTVTLGTPITLTMYLSTIPIGVAIYGAGLTVAEQETLASAISDLCAAFKVNPE